MTAVGITTITINGEEYVKKSDVKDIAISKSRDGMKWQIVRTYSAGVFAGYVKSRNGREVEMVDAIRIFYWTGAASLSQLAMEGVTKPKECKFAIPVESVLLLEAIEIIDTTEKARICITDNAKWKV